MMWHYFWKRAQTEALRMEKMGWNKVPAATVRREEKSLREETVKERDTGAAAGWD